MISKIDIEKRKISKAMRNLEIKIKRKIAKEKCIPISKVKLGEKEMDYISKKLKTCYEIMNNELRKR